MSRNVIIDPDDGARQSARKLLEMLPEEERQTLSEGEEKRLFQMFVAGMEEGDHFHEGDIERITDWAMLVRIQSQLLDLALAGHASIHIDPESAIGLRFEYHEETPLIET